MLKFKFPRLAYAYEFDFLRLQKETGLERALSTVLPRTFRLCSLVPSYVLARDIIVMDRSRSQSPRRSGRGSASDRHSGGFGGDNYFDWSTSFDHEDGKNEFICMQWVIPSRNLLFRFSCLLFGREMSPS